MVDWEAEGKVMPDFAKLEGKKGKGAQQEGDLPLWAARQHKVFTNWINNKVADRNLTVCDLFVDLQATLPGKWSQELLDSLFKFPDGTVLYGLLEVLSKQSLASFGRVKPEKHKIKKIANMNIVWKYLGSTVRLVGIGPTDIVDGNVTLTLGMIWSLIVFFMAKDLGDSGDGLSVLKKRLQDWMAKRTRHYPDVNTTDFTGSLADGRAFLAMLDDFDPEECPYDPSDNAAENLRTAFEGFERLFNVGAILDPDDPHCCEDEKANITYLAELMKAMPVREDDDEDGEGRRARREKDPRKAALRRAKKNFPETVEKLREICAYGPADGEACATKVAELMENMGLTNVEVVMPSDPSEDPSFRGDPFVVGERAGPPGTPTVLFYSSYGTADELRAAGLTISEAGSKDGDGSEAGAGVKNVGDEGTTDWATDPLILTAANGNPVEDSGSRLVARGVAQDKGGVIWQLAAIEALLQAPSASALPCGVKVIVGGTPPPGMVAGNGQVEVAERLADFLKAHRAITGKPDLVVVSEPGGAYLAPGKSAVVVGCRGFASLGLSVSTFDDVLGPEHRDCSELGGPLIDPGRVLAAVVASIHDADTGALKVKGLPMVPDEALRRYLKSSVLCEERKLRPATGYLPHVSCAKETFTSDGQVSRASIAEQLTLLPAVAVTSLSMPAVSSMGSGVPGGPLGLAFPHQAAAGMHISLAPGQECFAGIQALRAHCVEHAPHGAKVSFDRAEGCSGWLSPPEDERVQAVLASRAPESAADGGSDVEEAREAVLASNPGFSPVPSAFARALPSSAVVVGLGVNDAEAKRGRTNESILVSDLKEMVNGAVRLMHDLAKTSEAVEGEPTPQTDVAVCEAPVPASPMVAHAPPSPPPRATPPSRLPTSPTARSGTPSRHQVSPAMRVTSPSRNATSPAPSPSAVSGVGYTHRYIDDMERRNTVNRLRGRKLDGSNSGGNNGNNAPSVGSASPSPMASSGHHRSGTGSGGPTTPLFSQVERGSSGSGQLLDKHPLSPSRQGLRSPSASSTSTTNASGGLLEVPPELPTPPSSAMAAYAATVLGPAGVGGGAGSPADMGMGMSMGVGMGLGAVGDDDDEKFGGGSPETILAEINELRTNPRGYAAKLENLEQYYEGTLYQSPTGPPIHTAEGSKALLEAIEALKTTKPLEPMRSKSGMQQAASDHARDLAETSRTGHFGSDGSKAADRMNRYGQFFQVAGEVCTYFDATPEGIVSQLLLSDGERSRHNRKALLAPHFKCCGIAIRSHPTVGAACVITLAEGYGPRPLGRAADVVCYAGETPSAGFKEVLESIPVPQITEEVEKCLRAGMEVQLVYAPGEIKCTFVQRSGARKSMACKWA